jgi:uncharacterized cupin superfamily protein
VAYDSPPRDSGIDQQIWILEGAMEVRVGRQRWRLEAGDCLALSLDQPIVYRNPTRKPARYLVALATQTRSPKRSSR